ALPVLPGIPFPYSIPLPLLRLWKTQNRAVNRPAHPDRITLPGSFHPAISGNSGYPSGSCILDDGSLCTPSSYLDQSRSYPRHQIPPACIPLRTRRRRKNRKTRYAHASVFSPVPTGSTSTETQLNRKPQFGHSYLNSSSPNTSVSSSVDPISSLLVPVPSLSTGRSAVM